MHTFKMSLYVLFIFWFFNIFTVFSIVSLVLQADTVFLSPPWGGPDYAKVRTYDIKTMLKPRDGWVFFSKLDVRLAWRQVLTSCCSDLYSCRYFLFNTAKKIASRVVMFLPRNVDLNQLAELCLSSHPPWALEVLILFIQWDFSYE